MIDIAGQEIKVDDFVVNPAHGRDFKLSMNKVLGMSKDENLNIVFKNIVNIFHLEKTIKEVLKTLNDAGHKATIQNNKIIVQVNVPVQNIEIKIIYV